MESSLSGRCLEVLSIEYYENMDDGTRYIKNIKHIACYLENGHDGHHFYDNNNGIRYWW